jgi:hypothetical protein
VARCAASLGYKRAGLPTRTNSAAAYGSVMHHALTQLHRDLHAGVSFEVAVLRAQENFVHFWSWRLTAYLWPDATR